MMGEWVPPVVTRWWLEGFGPIRGEIATGLVTESSTDPDASPCPVQPPVKTATDWLSPHGVGVSVEFHGAGGWVESITSTREQPDETKARKVRDADRRKTEGRLL